MKTAEYEKTVSRVVINTSQVEIRRSTAFTKFELFGAIGLLIMMFALAGGAALKQSAVVDEVAHISAGVSYLQKLDLRMNAEHPPLAKVLAALPLVARGAHADYSSLMWNVSSKPFGAWCAQWVFGEWFLHRWNRTNDVLAWARFPMLLITLLLGWVLYVEARRFGGPWAGMLCLICYATTPLFLAFGTYVLNDVALGLFVLLSCITMANIWQDPTRKNALLFGLALGGALLTKFSSGIILFIMLAFELSLLVRPLPGQPADKDEARRWRQARRRMIFRGILYAAVLVYVVYLVLSWNQPTDPLAAFGSGFIARCARRLVMPIFLFVRGVVLVLINSGRPTYMLGHRSPHAVWYFFPVLFGLKSSLGFLGLIFLTVVLAIRAKLRSRDLALVPLERRIHWRSVLLFLIIFTAACLASPLDYGYRHFTVPLVFIILVLAPLPKLLRELGLSAPNMQKAGIGFAIVLCAGCLFTALHQYPYYIPYINAFGAGRPLYFLVGSCDADWNQAFPAVEEFALNHGSDSIAVDEYGSDDISMVVPHGHLWNCQTPTAADAGKWVAVSSNMIMSDESCLWLTGYPHEALAGGSMLAFHLPLQIPPRGQPGGPPNPSEYHFLWGMHLDPRPSFIQNIRDPNTLPGVISYLEPLYASKWPRIFFAK